MSITAVAESVKRRGKAKTAVGKIAQEPEDRVAFLGRATKAEHWHVYAVPVDADVEVKLYAAQDSDGRWYASECVRFGKTLNQDLPDRDAVLVPATAVKSDTEAAALAKRCAVILGWIPELQRQWDDAEGAALESVADAVSDFQWDVDKHVAAKAAEESKKPVGAVEAKAGDTGEPGPRRKTTGGLTPAARQREIVQVPMEKIHGHPHNRRIEPASCEGLADSLRRRGLLAPLRVRTVGEHWGLPEGHLQLIDGERRYVAAQLAGWDAIDAVIVDISDAEAEAEIAAANGQRQDLNDIERADRLAWLQRPLAEGGGGLTQTQAAAEMGISQPTASLLQSVGRLPDPWRAAIIAGEIPGSHLRPVAKYADCPAVLDVLWNDYSAAMSGDIWRREEWESRTQIEETVESIVQDGTRALTRQDAFGKHDYGLPAFDAAALDDATRQKLQIVEVANEAGDTVQRCLNTKLWSELNQKFQKTHGTGGNGKAGKSQPVKAVKPKKTPAEQRKADAKADQELRERIQQRGGLAEIALRIDLAGELTAGDYVTENLHDDLVATTRNAEYNSSLNYDEWKCMAEQLLIAERKKGSSPPSLRGYKTAEAYQRFAAEAIDWDNDPLSDAQRRRYHVCQLLLWPYSNVIEHVTLGKGNEWPARFPWIETTLLSQYAARVGSSVRRTWEASHDKNLPDHLWLLQFIRTHNTLRQRRQLCDELGVKFADKDKLADLEEAILAAHQVRRLKLPAVLEQPKAKTKKGGGK